MRIPVPLFWTLLVYFAASAVLALVLEMKHWQPNKTNWTWSMLISSAFCAALALARWN